MPAKHDTWMPLYIGDYLRDTQALHAEQHGAYLLLIMAAWGNEGRLPGDPEDLAAIARVPIERWQSHTAAKVLPFFRQDGATYVHDRVVAELERARTNVAQKSRAGAAGAAARWQKDGSRIAGANADALRAESRNDAPSPSPSPISSPVGEEKARGPRALSLVDLVADGLTAEVAAEWLAHRRRKKAPLTPRAWSGIKAEAARAGWTAQAAVEKALARGWTGFEADWVRQSGPNAPLVVAKGAAIEAHNAEVARRILEKHNSEADAT